MKRNFKKRNIVFLVIIIALAIVLYITNNFIKANYYHETNLVMGTFAKIVIKEKDIKKATFATGKAWEEILRLEKIFNLYDKNSELSHINQNASQEKVKLSNDMFSVIKASLWAAEISDGLFDITTGSLSKIYGFYNSEKKIPLETELIDILKKVNYKLIELDYANKTLKLKKEGLVIDLGGLAKGYAVDKAVNILKNHGIKTGLVDIGGNMHGFGNENWEVGIRDPRNKEKVIKNIILRDSATATSGDYERFFIKDNKKTHHIFNPILGKSATQNISVTVVANNALLADIFSTAMFLMLESEIKKLVDEYRIKAFVISNLDVKDVELLEFRYPKR